MRLPMVLLAFAVAACSSEPTPEEQAAVDAKARAEVIASQTPPPVALAPQKILYPDIEKYDLFGAGCNFVPEGGGMAAIVLAQPDRAYMKLDDDLMVFAADKGSTRQPLATWRQYDSRDFGLELAITDETGEQIGSETVRFDARMTVRDGKDRVVYQSAGMAQCGS